MNFHTIQQWLRRLAYAAFAAAGVSAIFAVQHWRQMAAYGPICGAGTPHCPACPLTVAFLMVGAILLAEGKRRPQFVRARTTYEPEGDRAGRRR